MGPDDARIDALLRRFPLRKPTPDELDWFNNDPRAQGVAGYAPDNDPHVVLNPFSGRNAQERKWVHVNEALRQRIREVGLPQYEPVSPAQMKAAMIPEDAAYRSDPKAAYETMVARAAYGDPHPGVYTPLQKKHAAMLLDGLLTTGSNAAAVSGDSED